jgi:cytochrome P450
MAFLEAYDALAKSGQDPQQIAAAQVSMLQEWIFKRPAELFEELRVRRPIFETPGPVVISRYRDVIEVVDLDEIYSVKPYGVGIMRNSGGTNFVLGMDNGLEFESDLSILRLAVRRDDLDRIRSIVTGIVQKLIDQVRYAGRIDITDGYAHLVPTLMVAEYFGVPGPDSATLMKWVRLSFQDTFLNFTNDPAVSAAGAEAGRQFRAYVDQLIAQIKAERAAGAAEKDDVIGRLISMQCTPKASFTDSRLRDNLIGCVTGVLENTNTAVLNILDWLLDHPKQLQAATSAAHANDNDLLLRYVLETLRFRPVTPFMIRLSLREHTLAKGTPRATTIPANKLIFAVNASAVMDETELDNPKEFRLDRASHHYLHFGWGLHQCLGKYISQVQVVEAVKGLLRLKGLRRAEGPEGSLQYEGPFAKSFVLQFDKR